MSMFKEFQKDDQMIEPSIDKGLSIKNETRLDKLIKITKFTKHEIRMLYQGFKQECPSGEVDEDLFKHVFSQFFPQGDASKYAHYVFRTLKKTNGKQCISFEDLIVMLSQITRGDTNEKLAFVFRLYDQNVDGYITKNEMLIITQAIYDMLGEATIPIVQNTSAQDHVDSIFDQIDENHDGLISYEDLIKWIQGDALREHNLNQFIS